MRVAIYARVSTDDKGQTTENQLRELREWCANSGHTIATEYIEHESGRKSANQRPRFAAMLSDAHKRKFDLVLVWSLDRLSREGMIATVRYLRSTDECRRRVSLPYSEAHLSTENELVRNVLLTLLASLAKMEVEKLSARVKAGMARAKARGKHVGRPSIDPGLRKEIAERRAEGQTPYAIAKALGIDLATRLLNTERQHDAPLSARGAARIFVRPDGCYGGNAGRFLAVRRVLTARRG